MWLGGLYNARPYHIYRRTTLHPDLARLPLGRGACGLACNPPPLRLQPSHVLVDRVPLPHVVDVADVLLLIMSHSLPLQLTTLCGNAYQRQATPLLRCVRGHGLQGRRQPAAPCMAPASAAIRQQTAVQRRWQTTAASRGGGGRRAGGRPGRARGPAWSQPSQPARRDEP